MHLKEFNEYVEFKYFPPLTLKVTNLPNVNGSGFGLFSTN